MEKIKIFLYFVSYDLKNYIFRFLSLTNYPDLGISNLYNKVLKNISFKYKIIKNKAYYHIIDKQYKIIYKKYYTLSGINVTGNKQLYIGKFSNNKIIKPYPYILLPQKSSQGQIYKKPLFKLYGYKKKI